MRIRGGLASLCKQYEDNRLSAGGRWWRGFSWSVGTHGTHALRLRPSGHLVLWFLREYTGDGYRAPEGRSVTGWRGAMLLEGIFGVGR